MIFIKAYDIAKCRASYIARVVFYYTDVIVWATAGGFKIFFCVAQDCDSVVVFASWVVIGRWNEENVKIVLVFVIRRSVQNGVAESFSVFL